MLITIDIDYAIIKHFRDLKKNDPDELYWDDYEALVDMIGDHIRPAIEGGPNYQDGRAFVIDKDDISFILNEEE